MERILSDEELLEYSEFKRSRREAEVAVTLKRLILNASHRETDKNSLKAVCESAKRLGASAVAVSPVNVVSASRLLAGSPVAVCCLVGGTGESLTAGKRWEAKHAVTQGASEVRLIPCYSALAVGNYGYLKREMKKLRRVLKRAELTLSLEDKSLGEEEIALGIRAAREGGADGVCVRGELSAVMSALEAGADKLRIDVSGVENAEQLKSLLRAGASRAATDCGEKLTRELYKQAEGSASLAGDTK